VLLLRRRRRLALRSRHRVCVPQLLLEGDGAEDTERAATKFEAPRLVLLQAQNKVR
jgi:hypothetical protein